MQVPTEQLEAKPEESTAQEEEAMEHGSIEDDPGTPTVDEPMETAERPPVEEGM